MGWTTELATLLESGPTGAIAGAERVGLLEAVENPRLLGAGLKLWPWQRDLLEAIEAGPRLHVIAAGRRASKSTLAALVGVWSCLLRPELLERLRPGERGYAVCVATSLRQARLFVAAARSLVEASPALSPMLVSTSADELVFRNGTALAGFPCATRGGRGWPIFALTLDEFAHHQTAEGDPVGEQVWASLVPSTTQFGDLARVLVCSTPAGSAGAFADVWRRADSGELPGARAYRATTQEANPTVDAAFLEGERLTLGEDAFRAEYLAEFTAGGGAFFDSAEVRAVVGSRREALPEEGSGWVAALDPSSGGGDPFALVVVGRDERPGFEGRLLVGHVQRWLPQASVKLSARSREERDLWVDTVLDGVAEIVHLFGAAAISDQHIPGVIASELAKRHVDRVRVRPWTAVTRTEAFQALRGRVATERIELLADEQLVSELCRVRTKFRSGTPAVDIPRVGDSHGDLAVALAAGVRELDRGSMGLRRPARLTRPSGRLPRSIARV